MRKSVLIFAQFCANCWLKALFCIAFFKIWSLKIFARINFRAPATNLQKFGTNFRAISRKSRFCAKMRENLSARKLVRIRYIIFKVWISFVFTNPIPFQPSLPHQNQNPHSYVLPEWYQFVDKVVVSIDAQFNRLDEARLRSTSCPWWRGNG